MKYTWKQQQITKLSAQAVGDELERLENENEGALLPATVVRAARPKRARLHPCFEWDDRIAANHYRENQARELLRKIVVVYEDANGEKEQIRAFVNIQHDDGSYYCSTARIIHDDDLYENVTNQILAELVAVKKKHGQFRVPALQRIWDAVDDAVLVTK